MVLIDGAITPDGMERSRYKDADVLDLMKRCRIELPDEFAEMAPRVRACQLTAVTREDSTVVAGYRRSLGEDAADPGWEQALDKVRSLIPGRLAPGSAQELISAIESLERLGTVDGPLQATRLSSSPLVRQKERT